MAFKRYPTLLPVFAAVGFLAVTTACNNNNGNGGDTLDSPKEINNNPPVKVGGQTFMMPSPFQIAGLVKNSGVGYDKGLLNPQENASKYNDKMKWGLNLGVYGADLGYITMYDQNNDALPYFNTLRKVGDNLKITASFDEKLMTRFRENMGKNKDSVMSIVGEAFRRSDDFLKAGDRDEDAALILTGGWIESMWFAVDVQKKKPNNEISTRIAEQKNTVNNLIKMLVNVGSTDGTRNTIKPEYKTLVEKFDDLNNVYQNIQLSYTFEAPVHEEGNHLTIVNGKTVVNITPEQLTQLTEKITAIRSYIIN